MKDYKTIKELIAKGYIVVGNVFSLKGFNKDSIENFTKVFNIRTDKLTLLDPSNENKFLIILRNLSTNHQVEILTFNKKAMLKAQRQISYQHEPIGLLVYLHCVALGGRSSRQRIFHLDRLIPSLDRLWGWEFILDKEVGRFTAKIRLNSTDSTEAEKVISKMQHLLDLISFYQDVGFHIQHISISPIHRIEPAVSIGQEERMLEPISFSEGKIDQFLKSDLKTLNAVRGLNQAYIENCMPSRLAMLWRAFESVFDCKPLPLLSSQESEALIEASENIKTLAEDSKRLEKLKRILLNTNLLSLKNRNERMSEEVAPTMKISINEAYEKIKMASAIRGKHLHNLKGNWKEIEQSENFLQQSLKQYAQNCLKQTK